MGRGHFVGDAGCCRRLAQVRSPIGRAREPATCRGPLRSGRSSSAGASMRDRRARVGCRVRGSAARSDPSSDLAEEPRSWARSEQTSCRAIASRRPIAHADPSRWPELSGEGAFARATTVPSGSPCRRQWPTAKQPRKVQSVSSNSTHTRKLGTPDGWSSTSESSNLAINSRSRLIVALSQHAQPLRRIIHGNRAVP